MKNFTDLTKQQKIALVGLIFLTILIIITGFFQFKLALYGPFKKLASLKESSGISESLNLKNNDTDKDGLNDYDEIYTYKTSPFLEDTDGDGIFDKQELDQGKDPLCPEGQTCASAPSTSSNNSENSGQNDLSTQKIRELLLNAGIDKETLDKIDDKSLKELYNETIKETGINPDNLTLENKSTSTTSISGNGALTDEQKSVLENLSAQDIRQFLLNSGFDQATLNQLDDATLRTIFLQAMANPVQSN